MSEVIIESVEIGGVAFINVPASSLVEMGMSEDEALSLIVSKMKVDAIDTIKAEHAKALLTLSGKSTPEERDTWPRKTVHAQAYIADKPAASKKFLLGLMADADIESYPTQAAAAESMANRIIAKMDAGDLLIISAEKIKANANHAIAAAETIADVEAALTTAAVDADEAAAAYIAAISA